MPQVIWIWASSLELALVHLTIGAAVVRYRLYELDRIISRTLAYGLLTVLLGGGYAVLVLGLGQFLGRRSPLIVAGATLAVAALFQPTRHRVQAAVDRRFNRRRHDAAQRIAAFSARLHQQIELDTMTGELLAVVEQTMQPTQAWLWLRQGRPMGSPLRWVQERTTKSRRPEWQTAALLGRRRIGTGDLPIRDGCSASTWTAPDGSSLLTLAGPSVQTDPDGSSG